MTNKNMEKIVFLVLVTDRKKRDPILTALLGADIHLIDTVYGKGTVKASYLKNTFGLVPEKNKAVIFCVTTERKADVVLNLMADKFNFTTLNTGIAFTMPVDSISF